MDHMSLYATPEFNYTRYIVGEKITFLVEYITSLGKSWLLRTINYGLEKVKNTVNRTTKIFNSIPSLLNSCPSSDQTSPVSLPQDILVEILMRLPSNSVIRFKVVSKSCLSLINDPLFIHQHLNFTKSSVSSYTRKLMFITNSPKDRNKLVNVDKNIFFVQYLNLDDIWSIRGPVNGIYCILFNHRSNKSITLALWNPTIRQTHFLPLIPRALFYINNSLTIIVSDSTISVDDTCALMCHGFGFDSSSSDYKVIAISCYRERYSRTIVVCGVQIYSFVTNKWKQLDPLKVSVTLPHITDDTGCCEFYMDRDGAFYLNGAFHWFLRCYCCQTCEFRCIVSFQFKDEQLGYYMMPNNSPSTYYNKRLFTLVEGCLALVFVDDRVGEFEVWIMREYGVQSSWCKVYSGKVDAQALWEFNCIVGEQIFYRSREGKKLMSCSLSRPDIEPHICSDYVHDCLVLPYTESLIPVKRDSGKFID